MDHNLSHSNVTDPYDSIGAGKGFYNDAVFQYRGFDDKNTPKIGWMFLLHTNFLCVLQGTEKIRKIVFCVFFKKTFFFVIFRGIF